MAETGRVPRPAEAEDFLSRKENVNTDRWDDLKWGEHSHAFTVAHSVDGNVCDTIHGLLNKAMANGEAFGKFKEGMLEMMAKEGWYCGAGHTKDEKAYINWRIQVIYDTNMKTAFAAGRYRQQARHAGMRPIWEYVSKLVGKNRREDHLAMHGKAFRWDDPIWNEIYPPNGWGCECSVVAKSESGAEREGVEVLKSDADGNPPAMVDRNGNAVDWGNFAPKEWKYNPGREALAPNFANFTNLPPDVLKAVMKNYNQSMSGTVMPKEEWKVIAERANEADYKPTHTMMQIGNLSEADYAAVRNKAGVFDSKVMATDYNLWHSMGNKQKRIQEAKAANKPQDEIQRLINQAVGVKDFETVYKTYSAPEQIFLERVENRKRNEINAYLHFTKDMGNAKTLRIIFHARDARRNKLPTAMQLLTMEIVENTEYMEGRYEKVK
ncbi:MAG: phage head morphogenesis protein [Treponema sp.]|jgi:SPP1 gp7 family putative phage head morphogenesis protein|nr:phage head morphogenesis protein [Treponema sp.]